MRVLLAAFASSFSVLVIMSSTLQALEESNVERLRKTEADIKRLKEQIAKAKTAQALVQKNMDDLQLLPNQLPSGEYKHVKVNDVNPKGPWIKTGLKPGDVIVRADSTSIEFPYQVDSIFALASIKGSHTLQVIRDGKPMTLIFSF